MNWFPPMTVRIPHHSMHCSRWHSYTRTYCFLILSLPPNNTHTHTERNNPIWTSAGNKRKEAKNTWNSLTHTYVRERAPLHMDMKDTDRERGEKCLNSISLKHSQNVCLYRWTQKIPTQCKKEEKKPKRVGRVGTDWPTDHKWVSSGTWKPWQPKIPYYIDPTSL